MDNSFWLERWDRREIGFHQTRVNPYLQQWWSHMHAPPGSTVFVPLCGKSLDMVWLRMQGHPVIGVELAHDALSDFFAENKLQPRVTQQPPFERWDADKLTLLCGDFFDLTAGQLSAVRVVFDRASLIALPAAMRPRYVEHMRRIVPADASTLLVSVTYPQNEMKGPPFSVSEAEIRALYSPELNVELLESKDVLDENARFRARGLTQMSEQVYRLRARYTSHQTR